MRHGSQGLSQYRTTVATGRSGRTDVTYYETVVVSFNEREVVLNTGGWWTTTTRVRMNQASRQFELGYLVFTERKSWYVRFAEQKHPFPSERVRVDRETGKVTPVE
jgi:hypothetical protein